MASSNYRRRIRTKAPSPEVAEKYILHWEMGELYHHSASFPRITSPDLFGNNKPLELEIGCGGGEYLVGLADKNPSTNHLGVDTSRKALNQAAVRSAKTGLDNIRFIRADIKLMYPLLEAGRLGKVYLHFPAPHSGRYRNRRIFTQDFLEVFYKALNPGGRLSFISDHWRYFRRAVSIARDHPGFSIQRMLTLDSDQERDYQSHFYNLWVEKGREINGFVLIKKQEIDQ